MGALLPVLYPFVGYSHPIRAQSVIFLSATLINQTLEGLLPYCKNAREVVMVGSSTPLYPAAFQETPISLLSGTKWISERKDDIFQMVSQCAGMKQLIRHGEKYSVRV